MMQHDTHGIEEYIIAGEALRDFSEQAHRALERSLALRGLSSARIKLMLFIDHHEKVRSIDMVQGLGFAPRTITEGIDALERDGLAVRIQDTQDRRAKFISLTEAGTALLKATRPTLLEFAQQMFGALDGAERQQLTGFLYRLQGRLKEMEEAG